MPAGAARLVRITAVCDHCNYKDQGSLHSIYHHLAATHIFHTRTDMTDECVRRVGVDTVGLRPMFAFNFFLGFIILLPLILRG